MRFVCDSCRAQYMISDEKIGAKGVKVRCKKCGHVILVRRAQASGAPSSEDTPTDALTAMARSEEESTATSDENSEGISSPLAGVADDEIGAVFDQVLSTSNQKTVEAAPSDSGGGEDDALSTRVLDEEEVKKLAAETAAEFGETVEGPHVAADAAANGARMTNGHAGYSNGSNGVNGARASNGAYASNGANGTGSAPQQDWFIAIDDRQVGPISLDEIKGRWEKGEIGPESLCWRAGFADWLPLAEVAVLKAVLPGQPKKASRITPAVPMPVVSVPVESSYNVGGVSRTVRSEVPMAAAAAAPEEMAWKPSAASALASLVKQEIEALTKPAPAPKVEPEEKKVRGIFDLPMEAPVPHEEAVRPGPGARVLTPVPRAAPAAPTAPMEQQPAFAPSPYATPAPVASPYATPAPSPYSTPAYHAGVHPAAPKSGRGLLTGALLGVVAIVLVLVGLVAYRVLVQNQPLPTQVAAVTSPPSPAVASATPPAVPAASAPVAPAPSAPAAVPAVAPPAAAAPAPAAAAPAQPTQDPAAQAAAPVVPAGAKAPRTTGSKLVPAPKAEPGRIIAAAPRRGEGETITPAREERQERRSGGASSDDEFESVFGTGGKRQESKAAAAPQPKRGNDSVYVPPPPGSADIPERLGQSDIMSVVLSNKPSIVKCVGEQKAKDPGLSGKLVVRWTIKTNGRTSGVTVLSDELRSTHLAGCITGLVKSWKFPAHRVQGDSVDFPFTF